MRILLILLLLSLKLSLNAQLFVTIEPAHFRPGIMYGQNFDKFGLYAKAWYGTIKSKKDMPYFYTKNIKVGLGTSYKINGLGRVYVGINHNYFFNSYNLEISGVNKIHKTSFDIGISGTVAGRFSILLMSDIWNWESNIGVGFNF